MLRWHHWYRFGFSCRIQRLPQDWHWDSTVLRWQQTKLVHWSALLWTATIFNHHLHSLNSVYRVNFVVLYTFHDILECGGNVLMYIPYKELLEVDGYTSCSETIPDTGHQFRPHTIARNHRDGLTSRRIRDMLSGRLLTNNYSITRCHSEWI